MQSCRLGYGPSNDPDHKKSVRCVTLEGPGAAGAQHIQECSLLSVSLETPKY